MASKQPTSTFRDRYMNTVRLSLLCALLVSQVQAQNFWQPTSFTSPAGVWSASDGTLYATTGRTVFRSTSNGASWDSMATMPANINVISAKGTTHVFVCTNGAGVIRSTNRGVSWAAASTGLTTSNTRFGVVAPSGDIFIGSETAGVFRSTNNGDSWSSVSSGLIELNIGALCVTNNGTLLAGVKGTNGIYRSTNNGASWSITGMATNVRVYSLASNPANNHVYAGTRWDPNAQFPNGVYRSIDDGVAWQHSGIGGRSISTALPTFAGGNVFIGSDSIGVFRSSNNGTTWDSVNTGLTNRNIISLCLANGYLYAGTYTGIFRSTQTITSVYGHADDGIPVRFELNQNYPNPFNPSTHINFKLTSSTHVSLRVFDILGREVATLMNGELKAGSYETVFDATGLSSGVYLYKLQAESVAETRKMILAR